MYQVKALDSFSKVMEQQFDLIIAYLDDTTINEDDTFTKLELEAITSFLSKKTRFNAKIGELSASYFVKDLLFLFVGAARKDEDEGKALEKMRISGGLTADKIKDLFETPIKVSFIDVRQDKDKQLLLAHVEGLLLKAFTKKYLKSRGENESDHPLNKAEFTFFVPKDQLEDLEKGLTRVFTKIKWTNHARWLSNLPPNVATPTFIANKALELSKNFSDVQVKILSEEECESLGMGSFLGVAKGSDEPAKFVIMEYNPETPINEKPYVFVGKGITFDSGGISIKGREGMDLMKHDMQGAAVVQSLIFCAAELKLPLHVIGLTPLTENLPSGKAYKPSDVVTALNGKTIEIISTDAEGRMILADALAYAVKYLKPELIIDIATLTGGVVVALGGHAIGLFSNNAELAREVLELSRVTERAWQLPLWDEYDEYLKSEVADFKNSAGRVASPITAARLLSQFAEDTPWVHLDIAGMAWNPPEPRQKYLGKGATAAGHRLLVEFLYKRCNIN